MAAPSPVDRFLSVLRADDVERRAGWRVVALRSVPSTNDEAARLRDGATAGLLDRVVVVADEQTAGRGRGGHSFESPLGGLYASLLITVPVEHVPAPLVFATAVALAEAIEEAAGRREKPVSLKWPNDVWIDGRKVAGILVETAGASARPAGAGAKSVVLATIGIGVNVARVPPGLPPDVAAATTAVNREAAAPVTREDLLVALLARLDARRAELADPAGRRTLESEYRRRLALRGEAVRFLVGEVPRRGVLRDVSLERGVRIDVDEGTAARASWWPAEHVREVRPDRENASAGENPPRTGR